MLFNFGGKKDDSTVTFDMSTFQRFIINCVITALDEMGYQGKQKIEVVQDKAFDDYAWRKLQESIRFRAQKSKAKATAKKPRNRKNPKYRHTTKAEAKTMKTLHDMGVGYTAIGRIVGKTPTTVDNVVNGKNKKKLL